MKIADRIIISIKSLRQLGVEQVGLYSIYQLGLRTGHYRRRLTSSLASLSNHNREPAIELKPCLSSLPDRDWMLNLLGEKVSTLYEQADEIVGGTVRLFGGAPRPLVLDLPQPLPYWTEFERGENQLGDQDIKYIWEPGRFSWACTLAMAYHLSNNERYANTFWQNTDLFLAANPPYFGPHWASAQEVAIRLVALAFSAQVFSGSKQASPERLSRLAQAIAIHAERILPTLPYARSQNNNHLISEALGLYTASAMLPEHPFARKWHNLGWKWLLQAFLTQIDQDGTYIQHSTNYHRLMLQAALWAFAIHDSNFADESIPEDVNDRLKASTHWLWRLIDPETGKAPNLGPNDGSYFLPLTVGSFDDYRPVIYAAALKFLQLDLTPHGWWCDLGDWLCSSPKNPRNEVDFSQCRKDRPSQGFQLPPHMLEDRGRGSWIFLRTAKFHSRPGHADQLHADLWWHGLNIAQDPGTYLYNAAPPWDNSLASAFVHNTVTIDGRDFMFRAGRFLYLDWAQTEVAEPSLKSGNNNSSLIAEHNGYRDMKVRHQRSITLSENYHWKVADYLEGPAGSIHTVRLHWLLPDWNYDIQDKGFTDFPRFEVRAQSPYGWITLQLGMSKIDGQPVQNSRSNFQLVRAGSLLYGSGSILPISGWVSPTYGEKIPALACILEITQTLPIELWSEWILPNET